MAYAGEGGQRISAPPCEKRPFGLLSVSVVDVRGEPLFAKGVEFDEMACSGRPSIISMDCPSPPELQHKVRRRGFETRLADAFVVYEGWECSSIGIADAWDNARTLLEHSLEWGVERAFWTGVDQDGNALEMSLAGGDAVDLTPVAGPLDVVAGVAALESYMADVIMCRPTIHANVGVGAFLQTNNLLSGHAEGKLRLEPTGTPVALGGGYPDTGPDGEEPESGAAWIFASGPTAVIHGPIFLTPEEGDKAGAVTRGTSAAIAAAGLAPNDVSVYAEKTALVIRTCGLAAVQVRLSNCCG